MRHALFTIGFFIFITTQVSAHTEPGIQPVLRFDETYTASESFQVPFLKFVQEEVNFPNHPQKQRFEKALSIIEEVLNSEEFKQKVLSYVRKNGDRSYSQNFLWRDSTKPLTNEEIFDVIMHGNEKMIQNTIGEMNVNASMRVCKLHERASSWCRTVVGSTTPQTSKWIELNWKFYSHYETHEMVENIVHEWLHLIGFLHGEENLHEEVPYVVGEIAGEIAKKLLQEN